MKKISKKVLLCVALVCAIALNARAEWQIVGDTVDLETSIVLTQTSENVFEYAGKLTDQLFKVTDGVKKYVHECGDNDPLGDSIPLRAEENADERGLRIRYGGAENFFKVTLHVSGENRSIKVEQVEFPKYMYIMGGPFNNKSSNWELQDIVALERDTVKPYLFYFKGDIRYNEIGSEGGEFKLMRGYSWSDNYHPVGTGNVSLLDGLEAPLEMRLNGDDTKWNVPSDRSGDGYWELTVNVLEMTLTVDSFLPKDLTDRMPPVMYVVGTATPAGFPTDNVSPLRMDQTESGVYEWAGMLYEGEFKFQVKRGTYLYSYLAYEHNTKVYSGQEYDVRYVESYFGTDLDRKFVTTAAGQGKIVLDLNRNKTWVEGQPTIPSGLETTENQQVSYYSHDNKLFLVSTYESALQACVFSVDGRMVAKRTFTATTEFTLPKGIYIVLLNSKNGEPVSRLHTCVQ